MIVKIINKDKSELHLNIERELEVDKHSVEISQYDINGYYQAGLCRNIEGMSEGSIFIQINRAVNRGCKVFGISGSGRIINHKQLSF